MASVPDTLPQTYSKIWAIIDRERFRQYCERIWGVPVSAEASDYLGRLLARRVADIKGSLPVKRSGPLTVQDMYIAASRFFD